MKRYQRKVLIPYLLDLYELEQQKNMLLEEVENGDIEKTSLQENYLRKLEKVLDKAYSVNILPSVCRNLYAVSYLYNYFATSDSDNLTRVIQNYMLSQIDDKGKTAIKMQRDFVFHQHETLLKQEKLLENYRKYGPQLVERMSEIAMGEQERETYMSMIQSHLDVSLFLAVADHFTSK